MEVTPVNYDQLTTTERPKLNSSDIRARIPQARAYDRILKVARRKADLAGSPTYFEDFAEAIHYPSLEVEGLAG